MPGALWSRSRQLIAAVSRSSSGSVRSSRCAASCLPARRRGVAGAPPWRRSLAEPATHVWYARDRPGARVRWEDWMQARPSLQAPDRMATIRFAGARAQDEARGRMPTWRPGNQVTATIKVRQYRQAPPRCQTYRRDVYVATTQRTVGVDRNRRTQQGRKEALRSARHRHDVRYRDLASKAPETVGVDQKGRRSGVAGRRYAAPDTLARRPRRGFASRRLHG